MWTQLLYRISRLPLQLTPLHRDRAAGLGFLAILSRDLSTAFVFALSCVVASSMVKELALEGHSPQTVWLALAVWLGFCLVLVLGPLTRLRNGRSTWYASGALLEYGRLATQAPHRVPSKMDQGVANGEESSWDHPTLRRHRTSTQP